jgi:hypothetical protein
VVASRSQDDAAVRVSRRFKAKSCEKESSGHLEGAQPWGSPEGKRREGGCGGGGWGGGAGAEEEDCHSEEAKGGGGGRRRREEAEGGGGGETHGPNRRVRVGSTPK